MPPILELDQLLQRWMAGMRVGHPRGKRTPFDRIVTWHGPAGRVQYAVEEKRHLATLDVRFVAERLRQRIRDLPGDLRQARPLIITTYVRPEQAAILEKAGVDFIDLAGNAHLEAPGLHVHVEGRKPPRKLAVRQAPNAKGWVKTTMAILIRPELLQTPYRTIAAEANVALGTVATCLRDLRARGLLLGEGEQRQLADRKELLPLWVQAYADRLRPALKQRWLQVQTAERVELWRRLEHVLAKHHVPWALTGADAAERMTHHLRAENTEIYAAPDAFDNRALLNDLQAQPAAHTGNLLVVEPPAPVVIDVAILDERLPLAPPLLVYAELLYRGTDQAFEAAELLLPRLMGHEAA